MSTSGRVGVGLPKQRMTFIEKCKSEPLVPIGALTTAAVLVGGLYSFKMGDQKSAQLFMRARIAAQFGTVMAMFGYGYSAGAIDWSSFLGRKVLDRSSSPAAPEAAA
ncbi:hypoxia induced protein conserved region-domain-containing protein [Pavlovales sp. CCMP2436]|nr:hypoxia induced protein conserved region-domain-containing protein [Pavlovales sp. CCMP2436]